MHLGSAGVACSPAEQTTARKPGEMRTRFLIHRDRISGMHGFQYLSGNKKASADRAMKNEHGSREDDGSEK